MATGVRRVIECLHRSGKSVARCSSILLASTRFLFDSSIRSGRTHDLSFSAEISTRVLRGLLYFGFFRRGDRRYNPAGAIAAKYTRLPKEIHRTRPAATHSAAASADQRGAGWYCARRKCARRHAPHSGGCPHPAQLPIRTNFQRRELRRGGLPGFSVATRPLPAARRSEGLRALRSHRP